jgi:hypothetical protein
MMRMVQRAQLDPCLKNLQVVGTTHEKKKALTALATLAAKGLKTDAEFVAKPNLQRFKATIQEVIPTIATSELPNNIRPKRTGELADAARREDEETEDGGGDLPGSGPSPARSTRVQFPVCPADNLPDALYCKICGDCLTCQYCQARYDNGAERCHMYGEEIFRRNPRSRISARSAATPKCQEPARTTTPECQQTNLTIRSERSAWGDELLQMVVIRLPPPPPLLRVLTGKSMHG